MPRLAGSLWKCWGADWRMRISCFACGWVGHPARSEAERTVEQFSQSDNHLLGLALPFPSHLRTRISGGDTFSVQQPSWPRFARFSGFLIVLFRRRLLSPSLVLGCTAPLFLVRGGVISGVAVIAVSRGASHHHSARNSPVPISLQPGRYSALKKPAHRLLLCPDLTELLPRNTTVLDPAHYTSRRLVSRYFDSFDRTYPRTPDKMSFSSLVQDLSLRDPSAPRRRGDASVSTVDDRASRISMAKSYTSTAATSVSISGDIGSQLHAGYCHPLARSWQAERQLTKVRTRYAVPSQPTPDMPLTC